MRVFKEFRFEAAHWLPNVHPGHHTPQERSYCVCEEPYPSQRDGTRCGGCDNPVRPHDLDDFAEFVRHGGKESVANDDAHELTRKGKDE